MADTQLAPQPGSEQEAHDAFLKLMEPLEDTPEEQEGEPTEDVEESTEETQDEPLEEEEGELEEESEEEPESDEDEEEETEEVYTVKVDGEEIEVSLDELVKGYSRQSDYTRKTQELASERNKINELVHQWANELSQTQAERQQYMEALGQFVSVNLSGLEKYANIDWDRLKEEDPMEFFSKRDEFREAQERIQQAQYQYKQEQAKQKQELENVKRMALQEEHQKLIHVMPDWGNKEKRAELAKNISAYALENGYNKEEIENLIDHRVLVMMLKAQKYDALQKSDIKTKKLKNKPKVVRSGKGTDKKADTSRSKRIASMKRLKETGRAQDAVSLFEDFVDL